MTSYNLFLGQCYFELLGLLFFIVIGTAINIGTIRDLNNAIDKSVGTFYRLAVKGFGNQFDLKTEGVIGDFYRGLFSMDVSLSLDIAQAKQVMAEALRINRALDTVHSAVLVANTNFEIIYVNESAKNLFQAAEKDIKKQLPNFEAGKLFGSNIDIFHVDPVKQRKMLRDLTDFYSTEVIIGGHHMNVVANTILDKNGERIGYVAEWIDRTEEVLAIQEITNIVQAASEGDFEQRVSESKCSGFILELVKNINQLLETSSVGLNEIGRILEAISHGDLTKKITNNYSGMFRQLKNDANSTVEKLREVLDEVQYVATTINANAKEIAAGNNDLSHRTEKQAASLEETAASMNELISTVKHNSENTEHANQLALGASNIARKGVAVVGNVVRTMEAINESSRKIVDIISVIDGITFQTNILTLNAAVEAARVGE